MSAIYGILHLNRRQANSADLERMERTLAHRGADKVGLWQNGSVGFGHRMQWTTPESLHETLPLEISGANIVITADARLDNREDLIRQLRLKEYSHEPITDGLLIARAYEKWGESCPAYLLGDFAFALWDARRQSVFCARDHFGVKPFYYHLAPSRLFAFATEIKGLFSLPEVPQDIDEIKVASHLAAVSDDQSRTFYKDVQRLQPGHSLTVSFEGSKLQRYWALDPDRELHLNSDKEYAESFRDLFREAVRCRLRSNYPVGAMLSGGLDSSSITCMARDLCSENGETQLHTFSAVFDQVTESDERSFQRAVLNQNNVVPYQLNADQVSPLIDLERVIWHQDEACFAGNLYLHWCQYEPARNKGIRVMLDGFDGDTTVSHGLGYLHELAHNRRWLRLAQEVKAYSAKLERPWWGAYRAWVWKYGLNPFISSSRVLKQGRRVGRAVQRRTFNRTQVTGGGSAPRVPFNQEFASRLNLPERFNSKLRSPLTEREEHHRLLTRAILSDSLEVLDKAAGAFGIELRYPFFDKRLAEFCLSLPPDQKMYRGWTRMVMRRAMEGILPTEVQWRGGKSDLGPSFDYGLRTFERARLEKVMMQEEGVLEKYLDITSLRTAYRRFMDGEATEGEGLLVWRALSLALWLQNTSH